MPAMDGADAAAGYKHKCAYINYDCLTCRVNRITHTIHSFVYVSMCALVCSLCVLWLFCWLFTNSHRDGPKQLALARDCANGHCDTSCQWPRLNCTSTHDLMYHTRH